MPQSGTETAVSVDRPTAVSVLIVDVEDASRNLCRGVVAESGWRTRTASTTEQATEILGNAEMLLAPGQRLSAADTPRLQTVVHLAVRLRDAWENHPPSVQSA